MGQLGLQPVQKRRSRPRTTQSLHREPIAPNRLNQLPLPPSAPNQVWCADITYLPSQEDGWLYLAAELDLCSKRLVGWKLSTSLATPLVQESRNRGRGRVRGRLRLKKDCEQRETRRRGLDFLSLGLEEPFSLFRSAIVIVLELVLVLGNCQLSVIRVKAPVRIYRRQPHPGYTAFIQISETLPVKVSLSAKRNIATLQTNNRLAEISNHGFSFPVTPNPLISSILSISGRLACNLLQEMSNLALYNQL